MAIYLDRRWSRPPRGAAKIDWGNWLANQLQMAILPGYGLEVVNGTSLTLGTRATPSGHAIILGSSGTASDAGRQQWCENSSGEGFCSFLAIGTPTTVGTRNSFYTKGGGEWSLGSGYTTASNVFAYRGGGGYIAEGSTGGVGFAVGTEIALCVSGGNTGGTGTWHRDDTGYVYGNGIQANTATVGNGQWGTANTGNLLIGEGGGIQTNFVGKLDLILGWKRQFDTASLRELTRTDQRAAWSIFVPDKNPIYFLPTEGAVGGSVFNPYYYQQHIAGGMHGESA